MALPFIVKMAIGWLVVRAFSEDDDDDDDDDDDGTDGDDDTLDRVPKDKDTEEVDELEDGDPVSGQTAQGAKAMQSDGTLLVACREDSGMDRPGIAPLAWWEAKPGNPCCKQASGETVTYGGGQIVCAYNDFVDRYKWKDVPK